MLVESLFGFREFVWSCWTWCIIMWCVWSSVTTSSCLYKRGRVFHLIDALITLSLFVFEVSSHMSCQCLLVRLLIFVSASWNVVLLIVAELGDAIASLTALSAISLPIMPVCAKIYRYSIFFILSVIIFLEWLEWFHFRVNDFREHGMH